MIAINFAFEGLCLFALSAPAFIYLANRSFRSDCYKCSKDELPVTIVIDIGSSSIKCTCICSSEDEALYFDLGTTSARRLWTLHEVSLSDINNAHNVVLRLIDEAVELFNLQLMKKLSTKHFSCKITAVGFSTLGMSLVGVNSDGNCAAFLTYQGLLGSDFTTFCSTLFNKYSTSSAASICYKYRNTLGVPFLHPSYALSQLLYLKTYKLLHSEGAKTVWMSIVTFIIRGLALKTKLPPNAFLRNVSSPSEASWTGIYESLNKKWCHELLIAEGVFADPGESAQYLPEVLPPEAYRDMHAQNQLSSDVSDIANDNSSSDSITSQFDSSTFLSQASFHLGLVDGAAASIGSLLCPLTKLRELYRHENLKETNYDVNIRSLIRVKTTNRSESILCDCKYSISVTIGTSAAVRFITREEAIPSPQLFVQNNLFRYRINDEFFLIGSALSDGGSLVGWWSSIMAGAESATLLAEFDSLVIGNEGRDLEKYLEERNKFIPVVLPFFTGERFPGWKIDSQGHILGMSICTTKLDILLGIALGILVQLRQIKQSFDDLKLFEDVASYNAANQSGDQIGYTGPACVPLVVSGGTLETSPGWRQLLADVVNAPAVLMQDRKVELTTLGVLRHMQYIENVARLGEVSSASLASTQSQHEESSNQLTVKDISTPRAQSLVYLEKFINNYREKAILYYSKLS